MALLIPHFLRKVFILEFVFDKLQAMPQFFFFKNLGVPPKTQPSKHFPKIFWHPSFRPGGASKSFNKKTNLHCCDHPQQQLAPLLNVASRISTTGRRGTTPLVWARLPNAEQPRCPHQQLVRASGWRGPGMGNGRPGNGTLLKNQSLIKCKIGKMQTMNAIEKSHTINPRITSRNVFPSKKNHNNGFLSKGSFWQLVCGCLQKLVDLRIFFCQKAGLD